MELQNIPETNFGNHSQYNDIKNPSEIRDLRRELFSLARGIRVSTIAEEVDFSLPQSVHNDEVLLDDKMVKRKRIVLLTPMCSAAACLMCPLPNEALDSRRRPITPAEINKQLDNAMADENKTDFDLLTVYTNGNFFADNEVPAESREHLYKRFSDSKAKFLLVESLPQFITEEKMIEAKRILGDKKLIVAIGLQSASDLVRAISVNTTCSREAFERTASLLKKYDYAIEAFLMIKPPFLTEDEAIDDAVKSIAYLDSLDIKNPILCATRVAPNTVLEILYNEKKFRTPWLWSIVEILKRSAKETPNCFPRVVISELQKSKNQDSVVPTNCDLCSADVIRAIEKFNRDRKVEILEELDCECRSQYENEKKTENIATKEITLEERVKTFVENHKLEPKTT